MSSLLLTRGIDVERVAQKDGLITLNIDQDRFAEAVSVLNDAGLPNKKYENLGDIFESNGLVSSPVQERARMIYALSEEIANTVSRVDGVVDARVHVVLPENDLLKRNATPSSASVFIRYQPTTDITLIIPKIKTLVANSISGLNYERVSVVPIEAVVAAQTTPTELVSFMGLWLLPASKAKLQWALAVVVFGVFILLAAVMFGMWRARQPQTFVLEQQTQ